VNLILLDSSEIDSDGSASLSDARAVHLRTVLRVKNGDTVRVGVLGGPLGSATVVGVNADGVAVWCQLEQATPPIAAVDLLLALPRPKVMRRLWPQLSALGVHQIILTNAERVERNYFDTHWLAPDVYRPLLIEGLQQARDTHLPHVSVHRRLRKLVEDNLEALSPSTRRLVAHPQSLTRVGDALPDQSRRVLLAVGPEGGWNAFELQLLERHGFTAVAAGHRTLRSDTACVALMTLVHDALRR
jgi:RsmE family RNA methyltransferase